MAVMYCKGEDTLLCCCSGDVPLEREIIDGVSYRDPIDFFDHAARKADPTAIKPEYEYLHPSE